MIRNFEGLRELSSRSLPLMTSALVLLITTGVAHAQGLCTNLGILISQSRSGFASIADKPHGSAGDHDTTLVLAGASYCLVTMKPQRRWYRCTWEFPYRAKRAYAKFDELIGRVNECIGQQVTLHTDQSVNHPDYYSLLRYEMEQAEVSVSVKDKGALGSTFVFIKVQGKT